ncbi:hypothetical protein A2954_02420 [Candidatus Roizmanbacteria bacterium RIFCSPLOWO2_01_FULL_37_12]|uniref:DUF5666 domain-containing protein n=1 Tax=Candidatus Roizmanbacteria bacterium RIFCSPLOWO2_01_FULL_37_12 TaxID=1802056 RepID=A0A1F7IEV0_9BACT|nr:MAG: hypothetical protein A2954_02420 [Candidatus Roizmanbacteria bacterium RIFCSPLOWO2_01_FULL_37_12]
MVKKLIAAGATAATILALAGGAFATGRHHRGGTTNVGIVYRNNVVAVANTGLNRVLGGGRGDQEIETGDAVATAGMDNVINSSTCGCDRRGGRRTTNIGVVAGNNVVAVANTGLNEVQGGSNNHEATFEAEGEGRRHHRGGDQEIETGDADAYAWNTNVVNSSVGEGEED